MGWSAYRDTDLLKRKAAIRSSGGDTFARTTEMRNARIEERKVHPLLAINTKKLSVRECRDSGTHPKSNAIALFFDDSGSMGRIPIEAEENLKNLMGYFLQNEFLPDVAVLLAAVGDTYSDRAPLQVGQFEPGAQELMDFFQRVYLEGNGGPWGRESYETAIYFAARHTTLDCFEKRGKKGYLILFGDEMPYLEVDAKEMEKLMGEFGPKQNIPLEKIIKEAQEKYVVLFIIPRETEGGRMPGIWATWKKLLGEEYVIGMEKMSQVCDLVGNIVGVCEGKVTAEKGAEALRKIGMGEEYTGIAEKAFKVLYGTNKDKEETNSKPTKGSNNKKKDAKGPKKTLKV